MHIPLYWLRFEDPYTREDTRIGITWRTWIGCVTLIWGHKPRGLWLYPRKWLDHVPPNKNV